jgi:hypothetical protein
VGIYYGLSTASATSDYMDDFGWEGGWRIIDNDEESIWLGGAPDYLWSVTPNTFILQTSTMEIVAAEKGSSPTPVDVLSVVEDLNI